MIYAVGTYRTFKTFIKTYKMQEHTDIKHVYTTSQLQGSRGGIVILLHDWRTTNIGGVVSGAIYDLAKERDMAVFLAANLTADPTGETIKNEQAMRTEAEKQNKKRGIQNVE